MVLFKCDSFLTNVLLLTPIMGYSHYNLNQFSTSPTSHLPLPLGSHMAPTSHLPYPPGLLPSPGQLLQQGSPTQTGNYVISSNSLPIIGREYFPQVGNLSLSSQDSWSSGFTEGLPDNSRIDRKPSSSLQSALEVSQVDTSNDFQCIFNEARNYVEHVYSL